MDQVKIAVVGLGNMGTTTSKFIHDGSAPEATLAAVCDINPARLAWAKEALPEAECFSDFDEMIEGCKADAVYIATPHYFHPPMAIAAMRAGYHVLTEKPAAVYTNAVRDMIAAQRETDRIFGIVYNQRTNPMYQRIRQIIRNGELGELRRIHWMITNWFRTQYYFNSCDWRATWKGEGGGVLINQSVHNLDLWQWMAGMPDRIMAHCYFGKYHDIEVEDDVSIFAEYKNGATAHFITTTGEAPGSNRLEIAFDRGKLVCEGGRLFVTSSGESVSEHIYKDCIGYGFPQFDTREEHPDGVESAHAGIMRNFCRAILYGEELLAPGADGIYALSIVNAALLSAWKGSAWVDLPIDGDEYYAKLQEKIAASKVEKHSENILFDLEATEKLGSLGLK